MNQKINSANVQQNAQIRKETRTVLNFFNDGMPILRGRKFTAKVIDEVESAGRQRSASRFNLSNTLSYNEKIEIAKIKSLTQRFKDFKKEARGNSQNAKEFRNLHGLKQSDITFPRLLECYSYLVLTHKDGTQERVAVKFAKRNDYSAYKSIGEDGEDVNIEVNQDFHDKVAIKHNREEGHFYVMNEKNQFLTVLRAEESTTFNQIATLLFKLKNIEQKKAEKMIREQEKQERQAKAEAKKLARLQEKEQKAKAKAKAKSTKTNQTEKSIKTV